MTKYAVEIITTTSTGTNRYHLAASEEGIADAKVEDQMVEMILNKLENLQFVDIITGRTVGFKTAPIEAVSVKIVALVEIDGKFHVAS